MHWLDCGNGIDNMCYPVLHPQVFEVLRHFQYCYNRKLKISKSVRFYFHLTRYLYSESSDCSNYNQLCTLCDQLREFCFQVRVQFYSSEFAYCFSYSLTCRKYGMIDSFQQHFCLLKEFHYYSCLLTTNIL